MNILLIGSGGREHALAWALSASPLLTKLYCAPGNPGIEAVAECVPIAAMDLDKLVACAKDRKIDFVVVGPEQPLVAGLWDRLEAAGIKTFGPSMAAARLEGSKGFVKDLCAANNIPMAGEQGRYSTSEAALADVGRFSFPAVLKMDGLAQGKGVVIAPDASTAARSIATMFLAHPDQRMVVEEFIDGEEASFFVLSDGEHVLPMAGAQDHKRVFDGDKGPNTGGMGAYSPAPVLTDAVIAKTMTEIIKPTIAAMAARGTPYMGVLFAGLMIKDGEPKLIEYNCRFGDPECQVLMMRLKSDLLTALIAVRDKQLAHVDLRWSDDAALTVVMATKGYPGDYTKGSVIRGLDAAAKLDGVQIFHAGTARKDGQIVANGGRVLNVTATGQTVAEAQKRAYQAVGQIDWPEGFCRRDIGWLAINR